VNESSRVRSSLVTPALIHNRLWYDSFMWPPIVEWVRQHREIRLWVLLVALFFCWSTPAMAGPPYATDDPEPVEFRHWEIYVASQASRTPNGWSGTLPFLDVNYGAFPNVHLHLMVPFAFVRPRHEPRQYGYGDTELGAKVRFIQETAWVPQIATFPTIELPSGNEDRGLGAGHVQTFLPLWLQKSAGPWTTYGGGGYWVNPGEGHRDWWFVGWQVQRRLLSNVTIGTELYYTTAQEDTGASELRSNVGCVIDLNENHHLLISAGRGLHGPTRAQLYLAYQLTFGPKK